MFYCDGCRIDRQNGYNLLEPMLHDASQLNFDTADSNNRVNESDSELDNKKSDRIFDNT